VHFCATRAPETILLESLGVAIHGQGFATRSVTEDLSSGYPAPDPDLFNIGLLHTSLDGRPGHEPYAPCTVDALRAKGYQYWALGHVHQREVVAQDPWIVFPGNIQGRHIRETGEKSCALVSVAEGRVARVEHRPVDVLRWAMCPVDISGAVTLDEVYDRTARSLDRLEGGTEGRLLAVRLRLTGACPVSARLRARREAVVNECRALADGVAAGAMWVEQVEVDVRPAESETAALARDDAFGGLLRAIRDLELDEQRLAELAGELADLTPKLPVELQAGADGSDPTGPAVLREALEDVKALLLERLLGQETGD